MALLPQAGFVSMLFIFLIISPDCVLGGRTRLLHNLHKGSGVGTHIVPSDEPFSESGLRSSDQYSIDPGYTSSRKLLARRRPMEATESGKPASKNDLEGEASTSVPAVSSSRRRFPFHTHFASKFPYFFTMAKDSSTVSPSPGTPSPGHN